MKRLFRVLRRKYAARPFDGEGAFRFGGRWSNPGVRLCYTSEHQSLALLEYFVHIDSEDAPGDLVMAIAEVPEDLSWERIDTARLPRQWKSSTPPPALAEIGDAFVRSGVACALLVPSALAPEECNWLLNPAHAEFPRIVIGRLEPVAYDPRLFRRTGRSG